mgnify:CR=1 FL=1
MPKKKPKSAIPKNKSYRDNPKPRKNNPIYKDGALSTRAENAATVQAQRTSNPTEGAGHPKGKTLMRAINEELAKIINTKTGMTRVEEVAREFVDQAAKGSFAHAKEIMDRQDGRPATRVEGSDGKPLKLYIGMPVDDDPQAP